MSDDVQKWCALGAQHLEQGEPEEALHWYERAIDADPDNADAWCGRAKSQYDMGRLERADRDYRHALRLAKEQLRLGEAETGPRRWWLDPETRPYLHALRGKGLCRYWLGDWPGAVRAFQRSAGLKDDGVVGPTTMAALSRGSRTSSSPPSPPRTTPRGRAAARRCSSLAAGRSTPRRCPTHG